MTANDLYPLSVKAYNGDEQARADWIATVSPIAVYFGKIYGVLPSLILGKIITESGWASDCYEKNLEEDFGIEMTGKARRHNNIFAINGFPDNKKYPKGFPVPAWYSYRSEFMDYGTHYNDAGELIVKIEAWKGYLSVEDCIEDWCANMRYQADRNHRTWTGDIRGQLLAIESYTPEGAWAERKGMHYEWQDQILTYYEKYRLSTYDEEAFPMTKQKMTTANLDREIRLAYEFAKSYCVYGPTDRFFPPMEDGLADCVGLALRAMYKLGYNNDRHNINDIHRLCIGAGMKRTDDANDVCRHHCVVCMCPKGDHANVAHVYYSLGGRNGLIDKYDLGSNARIHSAQPFHGVPVNEWPNEREFLCAYYVPDDASFTADELFRAKAKQDVILRDIAGKGHAAVCLIRAGEGVSVFGAVSTTLLNRWLFVKYKDKFGFVYSGSFNYKKYTVPKKKMTVDAPDGELNCRVGPGLSYQIFKLKSSLKNGMTVRMLNTITDASGILWYSVYRSGLFFFVSGAWLK